MTNENPSGYRSPNRKHERRFFYKYVTAETAKIILAMRKLRWSSPLQFNDPFDVTQELRLNFDQAELNALLAEEMASLIENGESTSVDPIVAAQLQVTGQATPDARRAMAQGLRLGSSAPTAGQVQSFHAVKETWREMVPIFRILCLSELHDVTSMWQHYSDAYRGVVLEFEAVDEVDSRFLLARPVKYQDSLPAIAEPTEWVRRMLGQTESSYAELFTQYQYVKTTAWSYEREWRIVSMAPSETGLLGDYSFHPRELVGIYFGLRCSTERRADLLALLTHGLEHIRVYEALPDKAEAKFRFRQVRC